MYILTQTQAENNLITLEGRGGPLRAGVALGNQG